MRMVDATAVFTARRNDTRPSSWRAMFWPAMTASTSGRFTSKILDLNLLAGELLQLFLELVDLLTALLPMMMPGRAVGNGYGNQFQRCAR